MARLDGAGVRVVLVGTGSHRAGSTLPDVPQVAPTIRELESCLVDACGVRPENLATKVDPENPEEFLQAVSDAAQAATDVLLVYYVGHGVVSVTGNLHLATQAAVDLDRMPGFKALSYESLVVELRHSRARTVVVVLDCCYSARAEIPVPSGALLASADRDEQALAVQGEKLTAFSGELVQALCDGISTAPGQLSLQHIHAHLARTMEGKGRPQPKLFLGGQAGKLVLASNRAYEPEPATPDPTDPLWDSTCPYRGLDPFKTADADVFHGRGALVEQLMIQLGQRARSGGITVVTGPSGSGKSSLLAAGVLPAITHGDLAISGSVGWPTISLTPGDDPLTALADRLRVHLPDLDPGSVRDRLAAGPDQARGLFAEAGGEAGRIVVVVDQFEEVFAGVVPDDDQRAFVHAVHGAAAPRSDDENPAALVVLGLRSDFHGSCARFPELVTALQDHQVVVGPMTTAELRDAVAAPAAQAGLVLQAGLVDQVLTDTGVDLTDEGGTAYDPGALPLLSHALLATWQNRRGNELTVDGYRKAGGVTGAVTKTADDTYASLDATEQRTSESVLPAMVNVGEDTPQDTRRRLRRDQPEPPTTTAVLEAFARARLVTLDDGTANLTHEALIRTWPRLREWINTDRADRQAVQRLETDAHAWNNSGDDSLLYRGARLDAIDPERDDLSSTARTFLGIAHRHERRAARVRRVVISALCVLTLFASGGAVAAFLQTIEAWQQRDKAVFNQVSAQADRLAGTDISLSAQLDLVAHDMRPDDQGRYTALVTKGNSALSTPLTGHTTPVRAVASSPDGSTLASADEDGTVRLWNLTDPANPTLRGEPLTGHTNAVFGMAFSPDGSTLATAGDDGTVQLWNLTDPSNPTLRDQPLTAHNGAVRAVTFSPDGRTLATAGDDETVQLWNVAGPANPTSLGQSLTGHTSVVYEVVFSPDGRTVASAGADATVRLWNLTDPSNPTLLGQSPTGHTSAVYEVVFSPDGRTLASAGYDETVRLWNLTDPANPTPLGQPLTDHTRAIHEMAFSPDGHTLATASTDQTVRLWSIPDGLLTGHSSTVRAVEFSPDGNILATAGDDETVRLWTLTDPSNPTPLGRPLTGNTRVAGVAISPDGRILAAAGDDGTVRLWNLTDPSNPTPLGRPLSGHSGTVRAVVFSPDGSILAAAGDDETVRLWNVADPANPTPLGQPLTGHSNVVHEVAFSPDGSTLASASLDGTVRLWTLTDPANPTLLGRPLTGHTSLAVGVTFSPDGRTLASASADRTVRLWNVADPADPTPRGQPLTGHTDTVFGVAFSPDGDTLATTSADQTVRLWKLDDGQVVERICATAAHNLTPAKWHQYVSTDLPYDPPCS